MKLGPILLGAVALAGNLHAADQSAAARQRKADLKAFDRADRNDDGLLDEEEFAALARPLVIAEARYEMTGKNFPSALQGGVDFFFDLFDADRDGLIDPGEWHAARSLAEAGGMSYGAWLGLDLNGNGIVTQAEVRSVLSRILPPAVAREWAADLSGKIPTGIIPGGGVVGQWAVPDYGAAGAWLNGLGGATLQVGGPPVFIDLGDWPLIGAVASPDVFSSGGSDWVIDYLDVSGTPVASVEAEAPGVNSPVGPTADAGAPTEPVPWANFVLARDAPAVSGSRGGFTAWRAGILQQFPGTH